MNWKIEQFIIERSDLAYGTKRMYRHCLLDFARWHTGRKVSVMDVFRWFDEEHPDWAASTKHNAVCGLKAYFIWVRGDKKHPVGKIKIRREDPGPQRTLDEAEVDAIFQVIDPEMARSPFRKGIAMRHTAMFSMMIDNGLRASEILSLTMENLDLENKKLCVRVKGGWWRDAVFSDGTAARLEPWLLHRAQIVKPGVDEVFINERSEKMTVTGFRANCYKIAEKAGIPSFSPHSLRRSMAVLALKRDASTRVVQVMGGWKDIDMVVRYSRTLDVEAVRDFLPTW